MGPLNCTLGKLKLDKTWNTRNTSADNSESHYHCLEPNLEKKQQEMCDFHQHNCWIDLERKYDACIKN